jgi:hypothetical protein
VRSIVTDRWFDTYLRDADATRPSHAELEIHIRTLLERRDPERSGELVRRGRADYPTVAWDPDDWERWKLRFKSVIESGWNGKLWLEPTRQLVFDGESRPLPAIGCRLTIELVTEPARAQLRAEVIRVHPDDARHPSSSMLLPDCGGRFGDAFGVAEGRLDDRDLDGSGRLHQVHSMHEMGHYLGLWHVAGAGNDEANYGARGSDQERDLMGRGNRIASWHTYPWRRAMWGHLDRGPLARIEWRGTTVRPRSTMLTLAGRPAQRPESVLTRIMTNPLSGSGGYYW